MYLTIFSRYCGQRTMTNKGAKRNVPHTLQVQQAPICVWSISETLQWQKFHGIFNQVNCFQKGMLEFEGPMGQCFSRFLTVSNRRRGGKRKKDTGLTKRVNPNSHIPHLQAHLAFAWHNRLVLDRQKQNIIKHTTKRYVDCNAVTWLSICS